MVSTVDFDSIDSGSNPDTVANKKKKPSPMQGQLLGLEMLS